jgi:hypothetical protein
MLVSPFGPQLFHSKLPDDINQTLYDICIKNQDIESKKRNYSLVGLIEKEFDILSEIQDTVLPVLTTLVIEYLNTTPTLSKVLLPIRQRDIKCRASWGNIQKPTEHNPLHTHPMDDIVCVCFPKIDIKTKSKYNTSEHIHPGTLIFEYGERLKPFGNTNYSVTPQTGDVWIFPAGLKHYTYPIYGQDDIRISTSSNFVFTEYFNDRLR